MDIWIVWAQEYDHSGGPVFIAGFDNESDAEDLRDRINMASPTKEVGVTKLNVEC